MISIVELNHISDSQDIFVKPYRSNYISNMKRLILTFIIMLRLDMSIFWNLLFTELLTNSRPVLDQTDLFWIRQTCSVSDGLRNAKASWIRHNRQPHRQTSAPLVGEFQTVERVTQISRRACDEPRPPRDTIVCLEQRTIHCVPIEVIPFLFCQ